MTTPDIQSREKSYKLGPGRRFRRGVGQFVRGIFFGVPFANDPEKLYSEGHKIAIFGHEVKDIALAFIGLGLAMAFPALVAPGLIYMTWKLVNFTVDVAESNRANPRIFPGRRS